MRAAPVRQRADRDERGRTRGPSVDALVAAGLVRHVPLADTGDRPRVRIEPMAAGPEDI